MSSATRTRVAPRPVVPAAARRASPPAQVLNDECTLHLDKPVEFYVYNTETDEVRVVVLLPTYSWGGGGCLGAAVAHGYLHRLPARCRESNGVSIEPERPVAPNARDAMAVDAPPPPPPPADVPPPQTEVPVA